MMPIERAARALCVGRDPDYTGGGAHPSGQWVDAGDPWWTGGLDQARAVLQAIREPSEVMTRKGGGQGPWDSYAAPDDADNARDVWLAMIDAALEEG